MPEQEPDTSKRVENVDKAWAMAHAEVPYREHALENINYQKKVLGDRYDSLKDAISSGDVVSIKPNSEERAYAYNYGDQPHYDERSELTPSETVSIAKKLVEGEDWRTHRVHAQSVSANRHSVADAHRLEVENDQYGKGGAHPDEPGLNAPFGQKLKDMTDAQKKEYDKKVVDPSRTIMGDLAAKEVAELYDLTHPDDKAA